MANKNETGFEFEEERKFERRNATLRSIVQVRLSESEQRKDTVELNTVSKNGADFDSPHPCRVGTLVMLLTPMPVEFRLYDKFEELYPVVGLVQNCIEFLADGESFFHISVAFTGKVIPESYHANPLQSYRLSGVNTDGSWRIVEAQTAFTARRHRRVWKSIDVALTLMPRDRDDRTKELAATRDISKSGASVLCSLDANVGDRMKFGCKEYDFYSIAVVKNVATGKDGKKMVHLEFVDGQFPMDKLAAHSPEGSGQD
jgi:hypothetical protein